MRTPDYRRDAEHQQADANDAARAEGWHRDDWADDEGPTRGELADPSPLGDPADPGPDPWGIGPVHHPTRFDLPVPADPPF